MVHIILSLLGGLVLGVIFRKLPIHRITTSGLKVIVLAMLFLMGIQLGQNNEIWGSLESVGITTLIITVSSMLGSILLLNLFHYLKNRK